jgi:hypothetical protein
VFSQAQALDYLGSKLTQRGKGGFERRRKSKVSSTVTSHHFMLQGAGRCVMACMHYLHVVLTAVPSVLSLQLHHACQPVKHSLVPPPHPSGLCCTLKHNQGQLYS